MIGTIECILVVLLIILIAILPNLSNKNKFKIKLAISGMINKLLIFIIIGLTTLESKVV